MARMTSRPRIGAILRDGMVRKGLKQPELAEAVGASRSAVNAWINDRQWPQDYFIAKIEDVLGVRLPRWWAGEEPPPSGDVDEEELRASVARLNELVGEDVIDAESLLRKRRAAADGLRHDRAS